MAYTVALTGDKKINFVVSQPDTQVVSTPKPADVFMATSTTMASEVTEKEEVKDVDMAQDEELEIPVKKRKGKKDKESKGIPRKALKNLIAHELETSAKETFESLMKDKNLNIGQEAEGDSMMIDTNAPAKDVRADETVEHKAACDGCGKYPITGIRYKCSVRKDFDLCAVCEERMQHPHAFLKIRNPKEVPSVMVTVLPAEEEQKKPQGPPKHHHGGHHGHHGHGPWGRGPHGHGRGHGPHHGGPKAWITILHKFMKSKGTTPEELHEMAKRSGSNISAEVIKSKFEFMDKVAAGENPHYDWKAHQGQHFGPMGWFKLFNQFV